MKRTYNSHNLYSSLITNTFELINRNIGNPNLIDSVPFNTNETKPTMQIIEINSDETESDKQYPYNHTNELENNVITINANDIKHLKREDYVFDNCNDENNYLNQTFNSHCGYDGDESIHYNKIQCLTIINNVKSDTSSDTDRYDDIEVIEFENALCDDIMWNCNNPYNIFEYRDICKEEKYKWMYSSKNMKKFLENDQEISSFTSNSTNSTITDDDDQTMNRSRVPTPIFNYTPKLNLPSSPLPTLTEVAEPNKQSLSDITEASSNYSNILRKSINSWLEDGSGDDKYKNKTPKNTQQKLSSLPERERRRSKIADQIDKASDNKEQSVYCEPDVTIHKHSSSATSTVASTEKDLNATYTNITIPISENVSNDEPNTTDARNYDKHKKIQNVQIKLDTPMPIEISDPVETLEGNWTSNGDDKMEVYNYDFNTIDSTVDSKDTKDISNEGSSENQSANVFLKVAGHARTPATCNIPSLHLSFETDYDEDKSCFKRIFKFILCCK